MARILIHRWTLILSLALLLGSGFALTIAAEDAAERTQQRKQAAPANAEEAAAFRQELIDRIIAYMDEMEAQETELPPAHAYYMGRRVAQTMHWTGAEWLTRPTRQREENTAELLNHLDFQPGMVVCDLGAGNGYYTLKISDRVGETGTVIAQELQPEMLELLRERAEHHDGHDNIVYVTGTLINPMLPPETVDMVLLVDVYHEFSHPEHMLRRIREALNPGGQLVLVEFRAEDETVPIKPEHTMSKHQMRVELEANGFKVADEYDELPWQHVVHYEVDEDWEYVEPGTRWPEELENADPPRPSREVRNAR